VATTAVENHHGQIVAATVVCGSHHGLAVVVTGSPSSCFSSIASYCFVLDCGVCHSMPMLGCFLSLSLASLIIKPNMGRDMHKVVSTYSICHKAKSQFYQGLYT